ncbi:MAG: ATP-binding protein [Lachnospiraceae bacterium]|nr:ATP-binding protein [Lachnospiraceae bacterium]
MEGLRMPIGIDDFAKLRTNDFYYVDKTGLIRDLLNNWGEVNLFTRPRRFGKSLNMSMLRYFFEIGTDRTLFDGLAISRETGLCEAHMGQYPVIYISLKTAYADSFDKAMPELCTIIGKEALRFRFLLESTGLNEEEKELYRQLIRSDRSDRGVFSFPEAVVTASLNTLSMLLRKHYGKKAIILIDEYDVPLAKANENGYYREMIRIIRAMFDSALKSNESLYFAVLTGCLRVSKESIFTGLNNPKMYTLLDARCDEYFGFTDEEVKRMLSSHGLSGYYDVTKEWYDGYRIARANVYNPWDVINWCDQLLTSPDKTPKSYWANSSGNAELRRFIDRLGNGVTKAQLERLIAGQSVQKKIEEQLTYDSIYDSIENMWSLLFATGYLTQSGTPAGSLVRLVIPNAEVRSIFSDFILKLFEKEVAEDGEAADAFCRALKNGEAEEAEQLFTKFMDKTISIRDTAVKKEFKESFYHGILLGILMYKSDWSVDSNRESGKGFFDIAIEIEDESIGIILEVKYAEGERFDEACEEALRQIDDRDYTAELRNDDMQTILKYGIACYKKKCKVVMQTGTTSL